MSAIKFFDFTGKEFPKSNLSKFDDYHKGHIDSNNRFHKIETFENNKIVGVNVFINDKSEIVNAFKNYPNLEYIEFNLYLEEKSIYAKYENFFLVQNQKIPEHKRINVYGAEILPIYDKAITADKGDNKFLWKHFYYTELNVEFEFEYEPNGEFKRLTIYDVEMINDSDNCTLYPEDVGIGKNDFDFNWEGMEYYKNAEPILPVREITTHNNVYKKYVTFRYI